MLVIGTLLLLLPGLFLLTVSGSTLSIAFGVISILCVFGSIYFARIPGRKNPLKFVSFLFPIVAIMFSKGYIVKYLHFTAGLPLGDIGNLLDLLFFAEIGLIAVMSYETANSLRKVATENGYDEKEWASEIGKLNNFSFGIGIIASGSAFLFYLFITSVPTLNINPLFALLIFGLLYLGLSRFFSRTRRNVNKEFS
ncbi:MAG: hypothetical protein M1327_07290 [Candidatus Thermoplasmatota archaeon]|nr:hypothetical protein [Candidatus Thermoplasmatota archaeon]